MLCCDPLAFGLPFAFQCFQRDVSSEIVHIRFDLLCPPGEVVQSGVGHVALTLNGELRRAEPTGEKLNALGNLQWSSALMTGHSQKFHG
ncbi:MAG: hypothetical protein VB858_04610, partial [Planctomycetaceae bacterium]